MPAAIWVLAIATFGIATTEFIVAGLLPEIATEFSITIPTAGYMVTSYALGVFVGAPVLIILGGHIERKKNAFSANGIVHCRECPDHVIPDILSGNCGSYSCFSYPWGFYGNRRYYCFGTGSKK